MNGVSQIERFQKLRNNTQMSNFLSFQMKKFFKNQHFIMKN